MPRGKAKTTPSPDMLKFLLTCSEDVLKNYELMPSLQPGVEHLVAALRHIQSTLPRPKCRSCEQPCDRNSELYCTVHLEEARERMRPKNIRKPRDPRDKTVAAGEKVIFLLNCSERRLGEFERERLNNASCLRNELQNILYDQVDSPDLRGKVYATFDKLVDEMAQVGLARWFRSVGREEILRALDLENDPLLRARKEIREQGRSESEQILIPSLDPGEAHRVAALSYSARNMAAGKCMSCPRPFAPNSVRYCTVHLEMARERARAKAKNSNKAPHGRNPGTLQSLAISRAKKSRAILASMGLPLGGAATALQGAKEAILANVPNSQEGAVTMLELFDKAGLSGPIESTAKHALLELVSDGLVQRIGKGVRGDAYLYFTGGK
jgi:hypothetical protein